MPELVYLLPTKAIKMYRKYLLLTLGYLLVTGIMHAQFRKGMRMVGGDVASIVFNSGTGDISFPAPTADVTSHITSFSLHISPDLGWFISEHTAVGATLNINPTYDKAWYESNGNTYQKDKKTAYNFGIGGFVRNYFGSSSSAYLPFGQVGLNFGISSVKTSGFFFGSDTVAYKKSYDGKSSGGFFSNASFSFGMTKLLSPHTGLDFFIGYNFSYNKSDFLNTTLRDNNNNGVIEETGILKSTTRFTNHGAMIGIGFQVFLDKRK
jgi:hypothetical protein